MLWTYLPTTAPRPGWWQMALDQALLDEAGRTGEGFLRCFRWEPPCLSFGRNEPALRRYDRARLEADGISVVRRPTGGRAVWHNGECTYAVAAPAATFGSLADAYRAIHETIADALRTLGFTPTLAPASRPLAVGAGACFAAPAGGEVLIGGRKVAGSAQLREGNAMLQHGSILLAGDQHLVARYTIGAAPPGGETTLTDARGSRVEFESVANALESAARAWPGEWRTAPPEWAEELAAPHADRFRDPAWTWRR